MLQIISNLELHCDRHQPVNRILPGNTNFLWVIILLVLVNLHGSYRTIANNKWQSSSELLTSECFEGSHSQSLTVEACDILHHCTRPMHHPFVHEEFLPWFTAHLHCKFTNLQLMHESARAYLWNLIATKRVIASMLIGAALAMQVRNSVPIWSSLPLAQSWIKQKGIVKLCLLKEEFGDVFGTMPGGRDDWECIHTIACLHFFFFYIWI